MRTPASLKRMLVTGPTREVLSAIVEYAQHKEDCAIMLGHAARYWTNLRQAAISAREYGLK